MNSRNTMILDKTLCSINPDVRKESRWQLAEHWDSMKGRRVSRHVSSRISINFVTKNWAEVSLSSTASWRSWGNKSSCEGVANDGYQNKHESLGGRSSGIPDANGSWSRICVERLPGSACKAISLVH
jgi:hypothetical protein